MTTSTLTPETTVPGTGQPLSSEVVAVRKAIEAFVRTRDQSKLTRILGTFDDMASPEQFDQIWGDGIWVDSGNTEFEAANDQPTGGEMADRITFEADKCGGKPCVRGMRIRVSDVLGLLSIGLTTEQVLAEMPTLEREDVLACLAYATRRADHPRLVSA